MRRRLLVALLFPVLAACGDGSDPDMDFGGEEIGPDRHAMLSEDGEVKMGLTDRYIYFALSDAAVSEARAEMSEEADREGVAGMVGGVVETAVGKALGFRAKFPVSEVRDIRWEDGRMRIEFEDPDRRVGDAFRINDRPAETGFAEEDVRAFAKAFRAVKEGRRSATGS